MGQRNEPLEIPEIAEILQYEIYFLAGFSMNTDKMLNRVLSSYLNMFSAGPILLVGPIIVYQPFDYTLVKISGDHTIYGNAYW